MRFLIHNFERRGNVATLVPGRAPALPCTDWIDVECVECGSSWIATPGHGPGSYQCIGMCEALRIACRRCGHTGTVPVPR